MREGKDLRVRPKVGGQKFTCYRRVWGGPEPVSKGDGPCEREIVSEGKEKHHSESSL